MALGSNNPFPSVLFTEQASAPTTPASGKQRVYPKTDGRFHAVDDAGAERNLEAEQEVLTTDPTSPADGVAWFFSDGASPPTLSVKWRIGGVTYTFPIGTATT